VRNLGAGYLWVSLSKAPTYVEFNGETWTMINRGEYVRSNAIAIYRPSNFQGVVLDAQPAMPFAWILKPVQPSRTPGGPPDAAAPTLARYTMVTLYDTQHVDGVNWYQLAQDQWIIERVVGKVWISPRPENIGPTEKWIEVNLYEQTLAAYEGDTMVYATLVSSGLPQWATPEDLTRVWIKFRNRKMSGADGQPDYYFLEDVPWIMFFNQAVALHGAYWHDRFGYPHSHGCVNLAPRDAKWLFEWTHPVVADDENGVWPSEEDPGTWVWVHK
jgi:lipoprotein-anchoring transpeptidase ErfK/SrfK